MKKLFKIAMLLWGVCAIESINAKALTGSGTQTDPYLMPYPMTGLGVIASDGVHNYSSDLINFINNNCLYNLFTMSSAYDEDTNGIDVYITGDTGGPCFFPQAKLSIGQQGFFPSFSACQSGALGVKGSVCSAGINPQTVAQMSPPVIYFKFKLTPPTSSINVIAMNGTPLTSLNIGGNDMTQYASWGLAQKKPVLFTANAIFAGQADFTISPALNSSATIYLPNNEASATVMVNGIATNVILSGSNRAFTIRP